MPRFLGSLVLLLSLTSPLLGAGREIGGVRAEAPVPMLAPSSVASNGSGFLMAWSAYWLTYRAIQVAAVDAEGNPSPAITLTTTSTLISWPQVVAVDDDYAVVWRDDLTIRMAIVDADGHLLRQLSILQVPDPTADPMVAADRGRIAVVVKPNGSDDVRAMVVDASGTTIADRSTLLRGGRVGAIAFQGDDLLLGISASLSSLVRIPVSGVAITTAPLQFTKGVEAMESAGENVLTVWTTNRGEGLTSASADREGELIASTALARGLHGAAWPKLAKSGDRYLLSFLATPDPKGTSPTGVYALLLDASGRAIGEPLEAFHLSGYLVPGVAATETRALVAVKETAILLDTGNALQVKTSALVARQKPMQRSIALATNGLDFLSSFREADSSSAAIATIRFDGQETVVQPPLPASQSPLFRVAQQALAFGGNVYLHASMDGGAVALRRLTPYGALIDRTPILIPARAADAPAVASDGTSFLVVWSDYAQLLGAIVSADGTVGPVRTLFERASRQPDMPRIAFDGTRFVVTFRQLVVTGFPTGIGQEQFSAVAVTRDGVAGPAVDLFRSLQSEAPIASSGRDFLVVGNMDNDVIGWTLVADGSTLRVTQKTSFVHGLDAAATVAWNGSAYVVAWRLLGAYNYSRQPPETFLGVTHSRADGTFEPPATIATGIFDTIERIPPAIAVNDLGVELIAIDRILTPGSAPRAVVYRSDEVRERIEPPAAPVITTVRATAAGEIVSWAHTSYNERGFIITAQSRVGTPVQIAAPADAASATLPAMPLPLAIEVRSWNEAGVSAPVAYNLGPPNRTPGRR